MPRVYVISKDWTLRANLRAELLESGFEALGMESVDDLARAVASGKMPSAIVLDAQEVTEGVSAALSAMVRRVPTLIVASRPGIPGTRATALEGATWIYKPVRIGEIVAQVKHLLAGQAA